MTIQILNGLLSWWNTKMLGHSSLSLANRRRGQRLCLKIPVVYTVNGVQHQAELLDISAGGMRLRVTGLPPWASVITVSPGPGSPMQGRQRIRCKLAWRRFLRPDVQIGLTFQTTPAHLKDCWVQSPLAHLELEKGRRCHRRFACELGVHLLAGTQSLADGTCLDISAGGCLIQLPYPLCVGRLIRLGLGAGRFESNLALNSVVLRAEPVTVGNLPQYRVKFLKMGRNQSLRLHSLIRCCIDHERPYRDEPQLDEGTQERLCRPVPVCSVVRRRAAVVEPVTRRPLDGQVDPTWRPFILPHPVALKKRLIVLRCPSLWAARGLFVLTNQGGNRHCAP